VLFTGRGLLTGSPAWVDQQGGRQHIDVWAGPWVLDERWWANDTPTRYLSRLQVVTDAGVAMLMRFGADGWQLEGVYD
jgi:protein ImuB